MRQILKKTILKRDSSIIHLLLFLCFLYSSSGFSQQIVNTLDKDGAWCWFSDPRAILVDSILITGWVNSKGSIIAAKLNTDTKKISKYELYHKLEKDDHNNPVFAVNKDGEVIALYTKHSKKHLYQNLLNSINGPFQFGKTRRLYPFSKKDLYKYRKPTITYANPILLNNILFNFGRYTGFKPNLMWSDDFGTTWTKSSIFLTRTPYNKSNRPYIKYSSDGNSKIHMVFTDGHPLEEKENSVYYTYFKGGAFFNAKDQQIADLSNIPFEPFKTTSIYKFNKEEGRAWIADISQDSLSNPVILYTKSPAKNNHRYWYSRIVNGKWINKEICKSGKWFPKTKKGKKEKEPYYFGGMTIHPSNPNIIYISKQVNGVFEIERWETKDFGLSWTSSAITKNSKYDNVRPYIPRGLKKSKEEIVLWMQNKRYRHFTKFKSSIKYSILKN
ncbi:BNR-4 repeat-containing protein [Croceitalea marina]|uniref:BNR-4 repeat-containing protein n=1 Tax=Croceitalea marina TaxID=1775166 RepID=A0ABW5MYE1_9FLAO